MNQGLVLGGLLVGLVAVAAVVRDLVARGWKRPRGRFRAFRSRAAAAWMVGRAQGGLGTGRSIACMVRESKGLPCTCAKPGCRGG